MFRTIFLILVGTCVCMEMLPAEMLQHVLFRVSFVHLTCLLPTNSHFNKAAQEVIRMKYIQNDGSFNLMKIGLEHFDEGTPEEYRKLTGKFFKRILKDGYDDAIDLLFGDTQLTLDLEQLKTLQTHPIILRLACRVATPAEAVHLEGCHLAKASHEIIANGSLRISLDKDCLEDFVVLSEELDIEELRSLCKKVEGAEVNKVFKCIIEMGSIDEECMNLGEPDGAAVALALRIGKGPETPRVQTLIDQYNDVSGMMLFTAARYNEDKPFVLAMFECCRMFYTVLTSPLPSMLVAYDCDPEYYLALKSGKKDLFDEANFEFAVDKFKTLRERTIVFVKAAIIIGKDDDYVVRVIESFNKFVFDIKELLPFILLKGVSDKVAIAIFKKPLFTDGFVEPQCPSAVSEPSFIKTLSSWSPQTYMALYERIKDRPEIHSFVIGLFEPWLNSPACFGQIKPLLNVGIEKGHLRSVLDITGIQCILKDMSSQISRLLASVWLYYNFVQKIPFAIEDEQLLEKLKGLPNEFDSELLEAYLEATKHIQPNDGSQLALYFLQ